MRIHLTARANRELTQSLEYLTNENPAAAQRFIDTLEGAFDNLRQHPELAGPPARIQFAS